MTTLVQVRQCCVQFLLSQPILCIFSFIRRFQSLPSPSPSLSANVYSRTVINIYLLLTARRTQLTHCLFYFVQNIAVAHFIGPFYFFRFSAFPYFESLHCHDYHVLTAANCENIVFLLCALVSLVVDKMIKRSYYLLDHGLLIGINLAEDVRMINIM